MPKIGYSANGFDKFCEVYEAVEASAEAVDAVGGLVDAVEAAGGIYRAVEDLPRDGYPDASSDHQSAWNIVAHVPMRFFFRGGGGGD